MALNSPVCRLRWPGMFCSFPARSELADPEGPDSWEHHTDSTTMRLRTCPAWSGSCHFAVVDNFFSTALGIMAVKAFLRRRSAIKRDLYSIALHAHQPSHLNNGSFANARERVIMRCVCPAALISTGNATTTPQGPAELSLPGRQRIVRSDGSTRWLWSVDGTCFTSHISPTGAVRAFQQTLRVEHPSRSHPASLLRFESVKYGPARYASDTIP